MPFNKLQPQPFPPKSITLYLKAGLLAYASLYSCPFPVDSPVDLDNFISVTVAGAASDSHRFPYYP